MKKIYQLLSALTMILCLFGCTNNMSSKQPKEKTYDNDFITSIATGLDKRWEYTDSSDWADDSAHFKKAIQIELDNIQSFKDKKFKSSTLQELAISYINELKKGIKVSKTVSADSFYENWNKHYKKRTSILLEINKFKKIPVKNTELLDELLAAGNEAKTEDKKEKALQQLVEGITYSIDEAKSDEYQKVYFAEVENNTTYTIKQLNIDVNLINADGTVVDTCYIDISNWKPNIKHRLDFTVYDANQQFTKTENSIRYYETD